jgi:hypothetical protein
VAQVVDHLFCKREALSSNPSTTKKEKNLIISLNYKCSKTINYQTDPRLSKLNNSVTINEFTVLNIPKKKSPSPGGLTREFFQTPKEEIIPTLHSLFPENK